MKNNIFNSITNPLLVKILTLVAKFELEAKQKKIEIGQDKARENGKKWGGSKPGWRWKVSKEQIDKIIEMKIDGVKISKIAQILNFSRPTIYHVLKNHMNNPSETQ